MLAVVMNGCVLERNQWLSVAGVVLLGLSGLGLLCVALAGESRGLSAWLLPFGPWFTALLACYGMRKRRMDEGAIR